MKHYGWFRDKLALFFVRIASWILGYGWEELCLMRRSRVKELRDNQQSYKGRPHKVFDPPRPFKLWPRRNTTK